MKTYKLENKISGSKLIEILARVSSELGFRFCNYDEDIERFTDKKSKRKGDTYEASKYYEELGNPCAFDTTPTLAIKFPEIVRDDLYNTINCQEQAGTMDLDDIDINECECLEFKQDYSSFINRIIQLSKE